MLRFLMLSNQLIHYLDELSTPTVKNDGNPRDIDDFYPRVYLKKVVSDGSISLKDPSSIDNFSTKFIVERLHLHLHLEHLQLLQIRKEKKEERKKKEKEKIVLYEDVKWAEASEKNTLSKLPVKTLNLYFQKHDLSDQLSLRKPEKCKFIRDHIIFKQFQNNLVNEDEDDPDSDDEADEMIRVVGGSEPVINGDPTDGAESDQSDEEDDDSGDSGDSDSDDSEAELQQMDISDDESSDLNEIFTHTRSGRVAKTWRASNFM